MTTPTTRARVPLLGIGGGLGMVFALLLGADQAIGLIFGASFGTILATIVESATRT